MIDLLVLLICVIAAYMGWRRGALLTVLPVAGLVAGYVAAFTLYRPIGAPLVSRGVPALPAYVAAGLAALLVTTLLFRLLAWWVERRQGSRSDFELALGADEDELEAAGEGAHGGGLSATDRAGGAALGALWAFGVAMVVVWAVESLAAVTGSEPRTSSVTGRAAGWAVGSAAEVMTASKLGDEFTASTAGALFRDPGAFKQMLDDLAAKEDFRRLVSDPELIELLAEGRVAELARRPELERLLGDPEFRDALRRVGLAEEAGELSVDELAGSLTAAIGPLAGAITSLREDAESGDVLDRLDIARRLRDGELMGILTDADLAAVLSRLGEALQRQSR